MSVDHKLAQWRDETERLEMPASLEARLATLTAGTTMISIPTVAIIGSVFSLVVIAAFSWLKPVAAVEPVVADAGVAVVEQLVSDAGREPSAFSPVITIERARNVVFDAGNIDSAAPPTRPPSEPETPHEGIDHSTRPVPICPPAPESALFLPVSAATLRDVVERADRAPLTCEAQAPIVEELLRALFARGTHSREASRLRARAIKLCRLERSFLWQWSGPQRDASTCSNDAWCLAPQCNRTELACLEELAKQPEHSCAREEGLQLLIRHQCARFVMGDIKERDAKRRINELQFELGARSAYDFWCLDLHVKTEVERIAARDGGTE